MLAKAKEVGQPAKRSVDLRLRPVMGMVRALATTTLVSVAAIGTSAHAQCEQAKLTASDAHAGQCFGVSVGISGDVAVVGAPGCYLPGGPGAAYVFRRYGSNWV